MHILQGTTIPIQLSPLTAKIWAVGAVNATRISGVSCIFAQKMNASNRWNFNVSMNTVNIYTWPICGKLSKISLHQISCPHSYPQFYPHFRQLSTYHQPPKTIIFYIIYKKEIPAPAAAILYSYTDKENASTSDSLHQSQPVPACACTSLRQHQHRSFITKLLCSS